MKIFDFKAYPRYAKKGLALLGQSVVNIQDPARLSRLLPTADVIARQRCAAVSLQPFYEEYVNTVSNSDYAVSLELSAFVMALCLVRKPARILDLGSGFSSFVFRHYKASVDRETAVYSVDDDADWLQKTRLFLERHSLSTDNLIRWPDFHAQIHQGFDLVSYDLDGLQTRATLLAHVLNLVSPGGIMVLDDMHQFDYAVSVKRQLATKNIKSFSAYSFTKDSSGRYSYLILNV